MQGGSNYEPGSEILKRIDMCKKEMKLTIVLARIYVAGDTIFDSTSKPAVWVVRSHSHYVQGTVVQTLIL